MIHAKKLMLAMVLAAAAGYTASAQTNGSNSPYSRYGFGLLNDQAQGFNKGMSGVGYGMSNGKELNYKNPASYASIDSLSFLFDIGLSMQKANFKQGENKVNANNAALDYLTLGFRLSPNLGFSMGLMPYSTIGYQIKKSSKLDLPTGEVTQNKSFLGDGGLHEIYTGLGWSPIKPLSVGVNAGFLWGDMKHAIMANFSDATIASRKRQYEAHIKSYKLNFGVQYKQKVNKDNDLTFGLVYDLGHDIKSSGDYYDQKVLSGSISAGDTLTAKDAYQLPHSFGAGVVWGHKQRLRVGLDYNFQKWNNVKSPRIKNNTDGSQSYESVTGNFTNMHKVAIGMEFQPDQNGIHWRDYVQYRAGFSFTSPYTKVDGKDGPRRYSASIGVGLPIINLYNRRSVVNISAQYERVEPQFSGMITENYFRICIGLSFNERWFMKWKVE